MRHHLRALAAAHAFSAALSLSIVLAGCTVPPPPQQPSLYERLGKRQALDAVVSDAIGRIAADTRINAHFANLASGPAAVKLKNNLIDLMCERTGGPCVYRGQNMADAHEGMRIRDAEFDALVEDIALALDQHGVAPPDRNEAVAQLEKMRGAIVGH